jgi:hypothetical protein
MADSVLWTIRLLKTSLKQIRPKSFFDTHDAENDFALPFDIIKSLH